MSLSKLTDILNQLKKNYPAFSRRMEEAEAVGRWESTVGAVIAKHSRATRVQECVLWVEVDHSIWKSELHYRKRQILDALNAKLSAESQLKDILFLDEKRSKEPKG